jgi:hypothetical protein
MIERNSAGTDSIGYEINNILQELPVDMMLVFIPHYSMLLISKDDFDKINFNDPKSILDVSKGELQLLD